MSYTSDSLISKVLTNSQDAMFIAEGREFLDANEAALKMFGVSSKSTFIKMHPAAFSPEFQADGEFSYLKANKMIETALDKGFHRFDWRHKNLNEEVFNVEVTLIIFEDEGRNLSFVQLRELSTLK